MKIKIIRPTIFRKQPVTPSETPLEVTQKEAADLIGAGKAVAVKEGAAENASRPMNEVETTEIPTLEAVEDSGENDSTEFEPKLKRGKTKKASES